MTRPAANPAAAAADPVALARDVMQRALREGFALAGVTPIVPTEHEALLREWLGLGMHGEMAYLAEQLAPRLDPAAELPGARAVLMVADRYAPRGHLDADAPAASPPRGRVARYARGRDYHLIVKQRLHRLADALRLAHPGAEFRSFADTAPVLEREWAARCGLGWHAKNTMLINPDAGSWFVLGGFYTTLDLRPPPEQPRAADHCGTCTRCIDACPTSAITPHRVDARRCIAYLTIEHRGPIDPALQRGMGDWVFGCDVCQEVCPHNSPRPAGNPPGAPPGASPGAPAGGAVPAAYVRPDRAGFDLLAMLGWDEAAKRRAVEGSAMKRASLAMFKRNAAIAAGNALRRQDAPALRARLAAVAADESEPPAVRAAARDALRP